MKNLLIRFVTAESGATAVEYGLIVSGIAIALIAAANGLANGIISTLGTVASALQ